MRCGLILSVASALDASSIVDTLMSALLKQAQTGADVASGGVSQADLESMQESIEQMKEAQAESSKAAAEKALADEEAKDATTASQGLNQTQRLEQGVDTLTNSIAEMALFTAQLSKLLDNMPATPAKEEESGEHSLILKITPPHVENATVTTVSTASPSASAPAPKIDRGPSPPLYIYAPVDTLAIVRLSQQLQADSSQLGSSISTANSKEFGRTKREQYSRALDLKAQALEYAEFFEQVASVQAFVAG